MSWKRRNCHKDICRKAREPQPTSRHHRKPVSLGGATNDRNISIISNKKHEAYHLLFENDTPYQIALKLNLIYGDPDYEFVVVRRVDT